jgi:hypothetical protein
MKLYPVALMFALLGTACKSKTPPTTLQPVSAPVEKPSFFPVTSYIKGQLRDFEDRSMNPLKFTTIDGRTDSVWLKTEEVRAAVQDFLEPQIDSGNMVTLFKEEKFRDQTLNTFTFTYDPLGPLPGPMTLKRWDVYVDVETGKVKKVYMVKKPSADKTVQLTWVSDRYCTIVTIADLPDGNSKIESEQKVTWDF